MLRFWGFTLGVPALIGTVTGVVWSLTLGSGAAIAGGVVFVIALGLIVFSILKAAQKGGF